MNITRKDDTVREVLESAVAGINHWFILYHRRIQFEIRVQITKIVKDILLNKDDHTLIMIHQMDDGDDWEDENN
jgi:hypothetical protein